jgi:hypothetical protein
MRLFLWIALAILISIPRGFSNDVDVEKLARAERAGLTKCMSDSLIVIEKHRLSGRLFDLWGLFEATCGMEIERVKSAAENQLKEDWQKKLMPGQLVLAMVENASDFYGKRPRSSCSGTGCNLDEYRTCLMRQMPAAIKSRKRPIDFENQGQQQCEGTESAARSALTNDFDNVQKRHLAGGLNHKMNDAIRDIIVDVRQAVVVLYAEDLVKVQPGRKSCRPEMCGASPCISLDENKPTEYQCVINQK